MLDSFVSAAFPKTNRLNEPKAYRHVFDKPMKHHGKWVSLFVRANQLGRPRLGLAVTKKHFRKAVTRNRLRRLIRESFRLVIPALPNVDVVVFVKKGADLQKNSVLQEELLEKWQKLSAL